MSNCGGHVLSAKKDFDIQHPTKDGWRLRHVAPEDSSADVYVRGKGKEYNGDYTTKILEGIG